MMSNNIAQKFREYKHGVSLPMWILVVLLVNIIGFFLVFVPLKDQWSCAKVSGDENGNRITENDKLLGGLLHPGFDENSCQSRYQSVQYLKKLKRSPSSLLISKLRSYESLHRRCGPHTQSYNNTLEIIDSKGPSPPTECKYVIWIPIYGYGNRMISLASTFLYAILTNRVLLVDTMDRFSDLFCEPIQGTSWVLPRDFPISHDEFFKMDHNTTFSYGYMMRNNLIDKSNVSGIPRLIHVNMASGIDRYDQMFLKDEDQRFLQTIPWLTVKSDEYFAPSLFLIESFRKDLDKMFPDRDSVFHILGRYLFHPTNNVWGMITRYHQAYLARAHEKIGIQVRVLDEPPGPFQYVTDQIVACTMNKNILPRINQENRNVTTKKSDTKNRTKSVMITSLSLEFKDAIHDMYLFHPTTTGEAIQVHQPSHEELQKFQDTTHYLKALAEMYLLAMSDKLVTSAYSTFGYVAQSLGGLESWVLFHPENRTVPNPPCQRVLSMDPCFHLPPPDHFKSNVSYVRPCEDRAWGLKLYKDTNYSPNRND